MYLHPEVPSYEQQLAARDNMLAKHPGLRFCGAHLASLEWSTEALGQWCVFSGRNSLLRSAVV